MGRKRKADPLAGEAWSQISVKSNLFSECAREGFMSLEVLENPSQGITVEYAPDIKDLAEGAEKSVVREFSAASKKKKQKAKSRVNGDQTVPASIDGEGVKEESGEPPKKKAKKKKKNKKKKAKQNTPEGAGEDSDKDDDIEDIEEDGMDVDAEGADDEAVEAVSLPHWDHLNLHPLLMKGIQSCGFEKPTPIQQQALPPAVTSRKDVIGAAETGSGKTLSFALPIINALLRDEDRANEKAPKKKDEKKLRALILSPTRELTLQIVQHIKDVIVHCKKRVQVVPIVGGFSQQKQERLLSYGPEIVVGTPGRLWEMVSTGNEYLSDLSGVRFLVLDEADRMLEKGHFDELDSILTSLNAAIVGEVPEEITRKYEDMREEEEQLKKKHEKRKPGKKDYSEVDDEEMENPYVKWRLGRRQTFLFSATLMLPPSQRRAQRRPTGDVDPIEILFKRLNLRPKHAIVDMSKRIDDKLVSTLEEAAIECTRDQKDEYLYYVLHRYPGRSIVFVNAVSCLRRLTSVLKLLDIPVFPLHANMQQRQRVKNLDRFKEEEDAVLLASDVAARGLDIRDVKHVVHYQLPRTTDTYVHRSGRTARANQDGITISLISPDDLKNYRTICNGLKKTDGLQPFPVDMSLFRALEKRVDVAKKLDVELNKSKKEKAEEDWFVKQAREADLDLDDDDLEKIGLKNLKRKRAMKKGEDDSSSHIENRRAKELQNQLATLMRADIKQRNVSRNFITTMSPELMQEIRNPTKKEATQDFKKASKKAILRKAGLTFVNQRRSPAGRGRRGGKK